MEQIKEFSYQKYKIKHILAHYNKPERVKVVNEKTKQAKTFRTKNYAHFLQLTEDEVHNIAEGIIINNLWPH